MWSATKAGNEFAKYHANFAAELPEDGGDVRVSIAISQTAEALLAVIHQLETGGRADGNLGKLCDKAALDKAKAEADALKPHLEVLNFGKGTLSEKKAKGFQSVKRAKTEPSGPVRTKEQIEAAAKKMYDFLQREKSMLRSLLEILSAGGVFWAGYVALRTAKAAVACKPIDKEDFVAGAVARGGAHASSSSSSGSVPEGKN